MTQEEGRGVNPAQGFDLLGLCDLFILMAASKLLSARWT